MKSLGSQSFMYFNYSTLQKIFFMKQLVYLFFIFLFFACSNTSKLQSGDLIFQDLDNSTLSDAIENATADAGILKISHIGIVVIENGNIFVIEAFDSVQKTPLKSFLNRSKFANGNPKVMVGRLKKEFRNTIDAALIRASNLLGKPYDMEFRLNNDKYYCSELVYDSFLMEDNSPIFSVKPMSFTNKNTGKIDQTWIDYFKAQNSIVPEGELGNNPADYAKSTVVDILDNVRLE